jgi:DNA-binding transcriptional ArsR family regulator
MGGNADLCDSFSPSHNVDTLRNKVLEVAGLSEIFKVLGDETLRDIARELVQAVRANVTIDWTMRENVRARLRVIVKRILKKHGYPPDKQEKATVTVLEQAEVLSEEWAAA